MKRLLMIFGIAVGMLFAPASSSSVAQRAESTPAYSLENDQVGQTGENDAALLLGWSWKAPVAIVDETGDPRWKVAEAVSDWRKAGAPFTLVTNTIGYTNVIRVRSVDRFTEPPACSFSCPVGLTYYPPVSNGTASGTCVIELLRWFASNPSAKTVTDHELGHGGGLAHAPLGTHSIMLPVVSKYLHPQAYDVKDIRVLYPRR